PLNTSLALALLHLLCVLQFSLLLCSFSFFFSFFFFTAPAPSGIYTLSLHDALPIWYASSRCLWASSSRFACNAAVALQANRLERSEEHTSELQSLRHLVCRLLLEKKKKNKKQRVKVENRNNSTLWHSMVLSH